jgi:2-hydroxy-6-oxonona-2,4-dienedioate hydrolase
LYLARTERMNQNEKRRLMALNQSPRPTRRRTRALAIVAAIAVAASAWIAWRFHADVAAARDRAMRGSMIAQTRCGPIEYQEAGQGTPLLVVHGSGGGHDQGMAFGRPFAQHGMRVIAMSRFGYLRTPLPVDASPQAQADAHACLLDALGVPRAAVLGASAGALSAMQMAIRHPSRVNSLILVVPIAYRPVSAAATPSQQSPLAEKILLSLIGSDFVYWTAMHLARDQIIQRVLATPPELVSAASPAEQARVDAMVDNILPVSIRAEGLRNETRVIPRLQPYDLAAVRAPTLLISARDDGYGTYANAEYTAQQIKNAKLVGFEQGGHVFVGHDDEITRAVVQHVAESSQK